MSVLIPDIQVYQSIAHKIKDFQYRKVCDINYCEILRLTDGQAEDFVVNLLTLNEMSHLAHYTDGKATKPRLSKTLNFKSGQELISTLQLFKYFQCIAYNIELFTIEHGYGGQRKGYGEPINYDLKKSHDLLEKALYTLACTIIKESTDYSTLKWSDS
tara:strand:- start:13389 stop:13862 length:474 start_codon:yes stop_codon:yes gene_type:complete